MSSEYLTVQEALEKLRVKPASLYSYVSRGLVRRLKQKGQRQSFYSKIDVERLVARRNARRGHKAVAGAALLWGDPILETAISWIDEQGPHYRGHSLESLLASQHPFENVAELLWTGILPTSSVRWPASSQRTYGCASPHERAQRHFLDLLDLADGPTMDQKLTLARQAIVRVACNGKRVARSSSVAQMLATRWGIPEEAGPINAALILCAEHDLNASTFAARVAASTGAHLMQCFLAACAAHSGPAHGTASFEVETFLSQRRTKSRLRTEMKAFLKIAKDCPGFQHPLYPAGDPRARILLELIEERYSDKYRSSPSALFVRMAENELGLKPNIDLALVALTQCLKMKTGAASELFLLGRLAGWAAHCFEQYSRGLLLRPRAQYNGVTDPTIAADARSIVPGP